MFCSPFLPLAHGLVLELSASVLAIIRRCLQTGRRAHTPCQWVLQTRRRQPLLRSGVPEPFLHAAGRRNAFAAWPPGRIGSNEGFPAKGTRLHNESKQQTRRGETAGSDR